MKSVCRIFIAFIALLTAFPIGAQEQNMLSVATINVPEGSVATSPSAADGSDFTNIQAIRSAESAPCLIASGTCGAQGDNLTWELSCDSVLTIRGTGDMVSPETDNNTIPWRAKRRAIKRIIIEDGVTSIGDWAFNRCYSLTSIVIPNSVTSIGSEALSFCTSLETVMIPNSVTSIGSTAFRGSNMLTEFAIASDNPAFSVLDGVLYNKEQTKIQSYPGGKEGSYVIPEGVTSIGDYAFNNCSTLTELILPESIRYIGGDAFSHCVGLTSFDIPEGVTVIKNETFEGCQNLVSVTIPSSVTSIEESAFENCRSIGSIELPESVTSIGDRAFYNCTTLYSLVFESTVPPTIGNMCLSNTPCTFYVPDGTQDAYASALGVDASGVVVQEQNKLSVATVTVPAGQSVSLSFMLDNTSPVAGAQFTVTMPTGTSLDVSDLQWTDRRVDHEAVVKRKSGTNDYQVLVFSPSNTAFRYNTGALFSLTTATTNELEEGHSYPVTIGSDAVLANAEGTNVLTALGDGAIVIAASPDLVVGNVTADKNAYAPGGSMTVSWTISNIGGTALLSGWLEYISLTKDGNQVVIATHSNNLEDGAFVSGASAARNLTIQLPNIIGIDGDCRLQVRVEGYYDAGERPEYTSNNTTLGDATVSVSKRLYLEIPEQVDEHATGTENCYVYRSGDTGMDETVTIAVSGSDRIQLPASVLVPAGESGVSFDMEITDNAVCDADDAAEITFSMPGYPEVKHVVYIEDDEQPTLSASFSPGTIVEGGAATLTVSSDVVRNQPVTLYLSCSMPHRFDLPETIVLPANQSSVQLVVHSEEDELPSEDMEVMFYVTADNYNEAECSLVIQDNDIPDITLTINPSTISENAGPIAMTATLRRSGKTDNRVSIKLSDDSHDALFYTKTSVIMEAGVTESCFAMGVNDNNIVDGERVVTVTAAVYLSSCNCTAAGANAGIVTSMVTILDDDGPALTLKAASSAILEGEEIQMTLSRNASIDAEMTVTLSADQPAGLHFPASVTFPAGETSVTITISADANTVPDDEHSVIFTAAAVGFASGICSVNVTDRTLPDAVIANIFFTDNTLVAATTGAQINIVITNVGKRELPAGLPVILYQKNIVIAMLQTTQTIAVNETETLRYTTDVFATPGEYSFYAEVGTSDEIEELSYINNVSARVSLTVEAPFSAIVSTDKTDYKTNEEVVVIGQVSGSNVVNVPVEVYAVYKGSRYVVTTIQTDNQGGFTAAFQPKPGQYGHFSLGACYPGEGLAAEMAGVNFYGLTVSETPQCLLQAGDVYNGSLALSNPSNLDLTNITAEPIDLPEGMNVYFNTLDALTGESSASLAFTLQTDIVSEGNNWLSFYVRINTTQGVSIETPVQYFCQKKQGDLKASVDRINTSMVHGQSVDYALKLYNAGAGETGPIQVEIVNFMEVIGSNPLPSLASGDEAILMLRLTPDESMPLNMTQTGQIAFSSTNGGGFVLPYSIKVVSDVNGTLVVDVCDENTYYAASQLHVKDATVLVTDVETGAQITTGVTNDDGLFTTSLPAGYYYLNISADGHETITNRAVLVEPSTETQELVNLSITAIEVEWTVEETTVEDEYEIVNTVVFETHVPAPVVVTTLPEKLDGESLQPGEYLYFNAKMKNEGLIRANDVQLYFKGIPGFQIEMLAYNAPFDLEAQEEVIIPVKLTRLGASSPGCIISANTIWHWYCGTERKRNGHTMAISVMKCPVSQINFGGGSGGITGGVSGTGYGGGSGGGTSGGCVFNCVPLCVGCGASQSIVTPPVSTVVKCGDDASVCASITLEFKQQAVMTRQAFRGTLTITNGHKTQPMENIKLFLSVKNTETGVESTSHEFQINAESLSGFTGELNLNSGWQLAADSKGEATILFIPTKYAAETDSVVYAFGGNLQYTDPFSGEIVTRPLLPQYLTVAPTPDLELTYFMQRDVIADDPLTKDVKELTEDAEFALLINNKGYGPANNLRLKTMQPKIVANEKGLLIDFEIVSSQLNGSDKQLALDTTIATDFGSIEPHTTAYAQWWFQSTLLGHFVSYDVKYTHLTSYGNPDLSLIDNVQVREMIRSVDAPANQSKRKGWLVNYIPDVNDFPDRLYLSDGSIVNVEPALEPEMTFTGEDSYSLTFQAGQAGWVYGSLYDPAGGQQVIEKVVRASDGAELSLRNFWLSNKTLRDGQEPINENLIHFCDSLSGTSATYIVTYGEQVHEVLKLQRYEGVPTQASDTIVRQITLRFSKPVNPITFTTEDLAMTCNGNPVDVTGAVITQVGDSAFMLNFSAVEMTSGDYALTVKTATIFDTEGFRGDDIATAIQWRQYLAGSIHVSASVTPENSGHILPAAEHEVSYGDMLRLVASPAQGWQFDYWTLGSTSQSFQDTLEYMAIKDAQLTAYFSLRKFRVSSGVVNNAGGHVTGTADGIYDYGYPLDFNAVSDEGYEFKRWSDGETANPRSLILTQDTVIMAEFELIQTEEDIVYVPDGEVLDISGMETDTIPNIVVEPGGEVDVNLWDVRIGMITIVSTGEHSGQIHVDYNDPLLMDTLRASRMFMEYKLEPNRQTAMPQKWYAFALPFEVDIATGITRAYGKKSHVPGTDFMIVEYNGQKRAEIGRGWEQRLSGTLKPGTFYMIAVEDNCNRWLFEKKSRASVQGNSDVPINKYIAGNSDNSKNNGWNGKGNTKLQYSNIDFIGCEIEYLLFYNNHDGEYRPCHLSEVGELCVGQPFFIQAPDNDNMSFSLSRGAHNMPALYTHNVTYPMMHLMLKSGQEGVGVYHMYLTMHDDAVGTYTIGRDLMRMDGGNTQVPKFWCVGEDGTQLAAHGIAMPATEDIVPMGIYAPGTGEYQFEMAVHSMYDYEVELLYQGVLNAVLYAGQPVTLELNEGTTADWSLRIRRKAPTDLPSTDASDGKGEWYDVLGRKAQSGTHGVFVRRGEKVIK